MGRGWKTENMDGIIRIHSAYGNVLHGIGLLRETVHSRTSPTGAGRIDLKYSG